MEETAALAAWHAVGVAFHLSALATDGCWRSATAETVRDLGYGVLFGHVILLVGIATLWPVVLFAMAKVWMEE